MKEPRRGAMRGLPPQLGVVEIAPSVAEAVESAVDERARSGGVTGAGLVVDPSPIKEIAPFNASLLA